MKIITSAILLLFVCSCASAQRADSAGYFFKMGMAEKENRRFKMAYDNLKKAIESNPLFFEAQKEMGLVCIEMRQYENAKSAFLKAYELNPGNLLVLEHLAELYFWTRKWNETIQYANKLLEMHSGKRVNYMLGRSYYELENYNLSFRYLDAAFKEEPGNAEIPLLFARAFVDLSNYRMAVKYYLQALAIDSTKPGWIYETALSFAAIPDDSSAVIYYEKAAAKGYKVDNDFVENLSNSYILSGRPEKGIKLIRELLEKKQGDLGLINTLADACYKTKKYDEAIQYWDQLLQYEKTNARALYMIGMCYQRKGDTKKGEAICDKAIEMDPSLAIYKREKSIPRGL